jgi:hypothetical protein
MSQILVSMSLYLVITLVNSNNAATDVSGHSKQAQQSQVNVIPSYKLKQAGPLYSGRLLLEPQGSIAQGLGSVDSAVESGDADLDGEGRRQPVGGCGT